MTLKGMPCSTACDEHGTGVAPFSWWRSFVNRRTIGILAGVVGTGIAAWWWTTQRASGETMRHAARERGTVIFDNHAIAPEGII